MSRPLRVSILGAGTIAMVDYGVLPNMHLLADRVEVVGVYDTVPERGRAAAERWSIPTVYDRFEQLLDDPATDAVVNLTPITEHGWTNLAVLRAGKHLATEKPIATTMADADELCRLSADGGPALVCAPFDMAFPDRLQARRLLASGAIGKPAFARVRSSHGGPAAGDWPLDPTWFYQEGAGPLPDMGVYGIHTITGLLGPARRVLAVAGITEPTRTVMGGPYQGKQIAVTAADNVLVTLDFGDATFATVDCTYNVLASRGPKVEIYGRRGTLELNGAPLGNPGPDLELYQLGPDGRRGEWSTVEPDPATAARAAWLFGLQRALLVEQLAEAVETAGPPLLSAEYGRHVLEILIAAEQAASSGSAVELATTFTLAAH